MSDFISREAALRDFERCNKASPRWTPQRVKTLLLRQPASDVAEVVRCRDCDGRRVEISWCGTYVRCAFRDATGLNMPEDGFCSLGLPTEDVPKSDDFCNHGERTEDLPCES